MIDCTLYTLHTRYIHFLSCLRRSVFILMIACSFHSVSQCPCTEFCFNSSFMLRIVVIKMTQLQGCFMTVVLTLFGVFIFLIVVVNQGQSPKLASTRDNDLLFFTFLRRHLS